LLLIILTLGFASCESLLEPIVEGNRLSDEQILNDPAFFEGLLVKAYGSLPNNYNSFNLDVAADNAVSNLQGSNITRMATGGWTSSVNPISEWENAYDQIRHINIFLSHYQDVNWAFSPVLTPEQNAEKSQYILQRFKGEAYGLRAYFQYILLQYHAGKSSDGTLLGFPIVTTVLSTSDNWELPRNTFAECVQQIMNDLDTAIAYLPPVYVDLPNQPMYNAGIGKRFENRLNGNSARAIKARVALMAASPAFSESGVTWAEAATLAGDLLKTIGTVETSGKTFYLYVPARPREIIWEQAQVSSRSAEVQNFPPSLFGLGRTNPTQSLVDAFPMKNGYPKDHPSSGYDPANPYNLRDTRLGDYILFNGSAFKSQTINTFIGAPQDGVNALNTSTRTGYYIKKFMVPNVSLTPGSMVSFAHTYTLLRLTEVLLNYAEAANEAWGPTGDPNGLGFTAKSKIAELRTRAGITAPDPYLQSITSTEDLRELIRNERRIELCFEGFRFWDIRRWENGASRITQPATGVLISNTEGVFSYDYVTVEQRVYQPHMIYGPIPYFETLKYNLTQNAGW
jgi:starch-binding outer membrane protein, SusD/RagB family